MLLKIKSFFMALVIMLGSVSLLFRPAVPKAKGVEDFNNGTAIINPVKIAKKVYVIDAGRLRGEEYDTAICLQGLVNREKAQLYILHGGMYRKYFDEICKDGIEVIRTDADGNLWTLPLLIKEFKSYIKDSGYVLYRNSNFAEGLNIACNYATVEGWLAIPEEIKNTAEDCGLVLKKDISKEEYSFKFLTNFFNEYKDSFNKNAVVHVKNEQKGLRDLAIQQGFFITYSDETAQGIKYIKKILKWTGGNSYILGWTEVEKHFVRRISSYGCAVIPSDYNFDNSFLSAYSCEIPTQTGKGDRITADSAKHYAAILFSDGDNSQWVQNGFTEYYKKIQSYDNFVMSWTYPLIQQEINPACSLFAYNAAGDKNCLVAGASGVGYMNPSFFNAKYLDKFTTETAEMMHKSKLDVITILDDKPELIKTKAFEQCFDYYSRFENIKGGLVMLDSNRYESGKGKVWFSNGKPFVSVRLSLWYIGDEGTSVTDEWIKEQAEIVNSYAHDPSSVDGYSLINVNPWTVSVDNMAYFVSLLNEDVELVTADQLIELISENVEHTTAEPKK